MAANDVTYGPMIDKMAEQGPYSQVGRTSGNVPLTDPGNRRPVNDPMQGDLAELGMVEGYRNPLPGVPENQWMRPLNGGVPTA